ncbi:MAG TPA: CmcI family methyltransferase [Bryobacteraceae bacterium]|jgi:cephalosporin hydroxylase|nr:CmcI family methyltransferase [Bryobacteraceae bacterium]
MDAKSLLASTLPLPLLMRVMRDRPWLTRRFSAQISTAFHMLYHSSANRTWRNTYWMGTPVLKVPLDLWIYQEILFALKPDLLIETGTYNGGSAFFFASIFDLIGKGRVLTIDIEDRPNRPQHPRIAYLRGSSTAPDILDTVRDAIQPRDTVLVTLDGDHAGPHVLDELRIYSKLVSVGSYLILDDTNLNGNPISRWFGPGPMEACREFLRETGDFEVDETREKFYLTYSPRGFLKKVR